MPKKQYLLTISSYEDDAMLGPDTLVPGTVEDGAGAGDTGLAFAEALEAVGCGAVRVAFRDGFM